MEKVDVEELVSALHLHPKVHLAGKIQERLATGSTHTLPHINQPHSARLSGDMIDADIVIGFFETIVWLHLTGMSLLQIVSFVNAVSKGEMRGLSKTNFNVFPLSLGDYGLVMVSVYWVAYEECWLVQEWDYGEADYWEEGTEVFSYDPFVWML